MFLTFHTKQRPGCSEFKHFSLKITQSNDNSSSPIIVTFTKLLPVLELYFAPNVI